MCLNHITTIHHRSLRTIVTTAIVYTQHSDRKTVSTMNVVHSLDHHGKPLFGFGYGLDIDWKASGSRRRHVSPPPMPHNNNPPPPPMPHNNNPPPPPPMPHDNPHIQADVFNIAKLIEFADDLFNLKYKTGVFEGVQDGMGFLRQRWIPSRFTPMQFSMAFSKLSEFYDEKKSIVASLMMKRSQLHRRRKFFLIYLMFIWIEAGYVFFGGNFRSL